MEMIRNKRIVESVLKPLILEVGIRGSNSYQWC